jgi:predicted RND superfamily exporter protein
VTVGFQRGNEAKTAAKIKIPEPDLNIYVAGEPRLCGWVYAYANDVFWILTFTYCLEWILRWMYFHDWRGALRPTLTGVIAAFWGLGFVEIIGFALDPLILVMPFLITARAVSHAIQMHDRYYEEYERHNWDQRKAIVAAFAELFVPTFSGIATDAFGVLVIMLVPIVMLQKLAIVTSWWILAITVAELLLNPIVYYYLRAPDPDVVLARESGWYKNLVRRVTDWNISRAGRTVIAAVWTILTVVSLFFASGIQIGDPTSASPLVWKDSPYNVAHARIQEKFGGVEPLIIVAEGKDRDAMKDPQVLRTMEKFQRFLERDPDVGYSFSLTDILRTVNQVFHEFEPKWGVIPNTARDVGQTFFIFFANSPPTETAKYVTPDYQTAHVTFFCRNHRGRQHRPHHRSARRSSSRPTRWRTRAPAGRRPDRRARGRERRAAPERPAHEPPRLRHDVRDHAVHVPLVGGGRLPAGAADGREHHHQCDDGLVGHQHQHQHAAAGHRRPRVRNRLRPLHPEPLHRRDPGEGRPRGVAPRGDGHLGQGRELTAVAMVGSTAAWMFSNIAFNAIMGIMLAGWMLISFLAGVSLLPVLVIYFKPSFIMREANKKRPELEQVAPAVSVS